ncbi:hypothetical protein DDV21_011405 [Streptococcus chenjunshii]|uniref:YobI-like P-loop NTPase domain-containing protein n=1 Tax=Streptococcus chenjunshii TaxID=2173853 RepID=A0A372KMA8_9STRE|nr:hypothetical protein [Streptococcus chenjunshii]AXQ79623.1 hypothetical protein DDV21_011405 [Streptococcus chenjunshii]RFU51062.1 hypothetical protein DDV22_05645 [Streptococcus chenjunshii]RFU53106.1 hypothetical protein DDV23_06440 [Streptococcus chenjunshii]
MSQIFKKLTPINDADIDQSHIDAVDFSIEDPDVLNVAISGNYGSGKSSFIETYKKKYNKKNKTFLHISLAHFTSEDEIEDKQQIKQNTNKGENDNVLEGKIVNQLLHQIDADKIPLTIFKSKQHPKTSQIFGWSFIVSIFLLAISVLWNFKNLTKTVGEISPDFLWFSQVKLIIIIVLIIDSLILIYELLRLQLYRKLFKVISFKGTNVSGEIEILQDSEASYFDQYLDDVLYLFDNCQHNIIVFEDIDRFETNLIFSKLKEINTLVNSKRKARGEGNKLLFMYLVKDDMFISKERTKFFDFIIPIIPTITSSNSREKFSEILADLGCEKDFKGSFLQKISIYIDDLRLVTNICNEYVLYKNNLTGEEVKNKLKLSNEKLFAMVVYKNIFPKDFSELQGNSGFIYKLFQEKDNFKKGQLHDINEQISEIKQKILNAESEVLNNELELYSSILKIPTNRPFLKVNNKFEYQFNSRLDFIAELLKEDAEIESYKNYSSVGNGYYSNKETKETIFKIPDSERDNFESRLENIKNKGSIELLKNEINALQKKKQEIQRQKLANLITRDNIDNIASEEEFKYIKNNSQFSMITFLIRNSFIDETYPDYITYFYPNSMNREDKEFIMAVQGEDNRLPWDYHLTNITEIYNNRIDSEDFNRDEILNYDLFEYVISEGNEERLIPYFIENRLKFLISFFGKSSLDRQKTVVSYILNYNPDLVESLLSSKDFLHTGGFAMTQCMLFNDFLLLSRKLSPLQKKQLSQFVSDSWNFIWYEFKQTGEVDDYIDLILNLEHLNVKINKFNFGSEYGDLNDKVYNNNLYQLNAINITKLLLYLDSSLNENDIKYRNFTIINSDNKFSYLLDYVNENLEDYLKIIVEQSDGVIRDDVKYIYAILNHANVSDEIKVEYLTCVSDNILELSKINNILIGDKAIELNKAIFNTKNILDYFIEHEEWNEILINFVNSKEKLKFDNNAFKELSNENQEKFFEKTVKCNAIENKHYRVVLSSLGWFYNSLPEDLDDDKIYILIESGTISKEFEVTVLSDLRDNYPESVIKYILKYLDGYIENIDDCYNEDEILEILGQKIPFEKAQVLVDSFNATISVKDKNYSSELIAYILKNKFDDEDLPMILKEYQAFDKIAQDVIIQKGTENIKAILDKFYSVEKNLLLSLMQDRNINLEDRRLLYSRNIPHNNVEKLFEDLHFLNLFEEYNQVIQEVREHNNPKILALEYNKHILDFLQDKGFFKSFRVDSHNDNYYRIYSFRNS